MDFAVASKITGELKLCDSPLGKVADMIEEIEDIDERKRYRRAIASVIGEIYTELLRPIEIEHPSLTI